MTENDTRELPELGTAEAALRSCIDLIARATGQKAELLSYWLDLYYQVRVAYETGKLLAAPAAPARAEPAAPPPHTQAEKPSEQPKAAGAAAAAAFKRETIRRLQAARSAGLSTPKIVQLAEHNITEDQVRAIIDSKPMPVAVYRVLAAALDQAEKKAPHEDAEGKA